MSAEETAATNAAQNVTPTPETVAADAGKPTSQASGGETTPEAFRTLEEFRKEAPELYDRFMRSIQEQMINDLKRRNKRILEVWKKMRKNNS